jgi:hypothetical protein
MTKDRQSGWKRLVTSMHPIPMIDVRERPMCASLTVVVSSASQIIAIHHGTALPSQKNPPPGPSSGSVAAQTIPFAPSCTGRPP